jgi:DNA invertase Pin-like site-specific DNA recombinase
MTDRSKVTAAHRGRSAIVYVRQSSQAQLERNRESTARQYALVERARELGWAPEQIVVIDEDLGLSGSGTAERTGFARLAAETALGRVGLILGPEVSRLARNSADWYRLLDLCGITDTLIGDGDGIYHPGAFNDRLLLGLKGTMSEAELHVLRARLDGGIRNKAARGELRRGLPIGLVWGEGDGEILLHPDEAVRGAIATCFERFAERGSVRAVWLWFRGEGLGFPSQTSPADPIRWVTPTAGRARGRTRQRRGGGADPRRRALDRPPLGQRRVHRRRAGHARLALADPCRSRPARPLRGGGTWGLAADARGDPRPRGIASDGVAACQARRVARRTRAARTAKGPADRGPGARPRPL